MPRLKHYRVDLQVNLSIYYSSENYDHGSVGESVAVSTYAGLLLDDTAKSMHVHDVKVLKTSELATPPPYPDE